MASVKKKALYIISVLRIEENLKHATQAGQQETLTDSNLFHWPIASSLFYHRFFFISVIENMQSPFYLHI
jgi:hypothetical protein